MSGDLTEAQIHSYHIALSTLNVVSPSPPPPSSSSSIPIKRRLRPRISEADVHAYHLFNHSLPSASDGPPQFHSPMTKSKTKSKSKSKSTLTPITTTPTRSTTKRKPKRRISVQLSHDKRQALVALSSTSLQFVPTFSRRHTGDSAELPPTPPRYPETIRARPNRMSRSNEKERNPTNNGKKQTKINGQDQTMINGQDRRTINGQEHDSIESEQDELLSSQPRPRPPLSFNSTSNSTGTSDVSDLIPSSPIPSIIPASSVITSLGQRRLKKSKLNKGKDEFSTPIPTPTPTPTSTTVRGDEGGSGEVDKSSRRKSRRSSLKQVRKGPTWVTGTPGIGDA